MISLSDIKSLYEFLKGGRSFLFPKGVIIDFLEPFNLNLGASYSNFMPTEISINLNLVARNEDQATSHLIQEITAKLCGLESIEWISHFIAVYELKPVKSLYLPIILEPGGMFPIGLTIGIRFTLQNPDTFVEQLRGIKNQPLTVKVIYIVKEGAKTKSKELEKGNIDFYSLLCQHYRSYLDSIHDVKAIQLFNHLQYGRS